VGLIPPLDKDIVSTHEGYFPRYSANSSAEMLSADGTDEPPIAGPRRELAGSIAVERGLVARRIS